MQGKNKKGKDKRRMEERGWGRIRRGRRSLNFGVGFEEKGVQRYRGRVRGGRSLNFEVGEKEVDI